MSKRCFRIDTTWRERIPVPVFDEHPEYLELYRHTWELVHDHLLDLPGMPQSPYMDEAFLITDIWIWDSCFMSLFCKYAPDIFPGVETLNNFYEVLYGGQALPKVVAPDGIPEWTELKPGDEAQVQIHIADNPPLFAWAELQNARMTGDLEHVRELLLEKQFLQKHFAWLESLTPEYHPTPDFVRAPVCWFKHQDGYFWEGGRSGMDNTPRGRTECPCVPHRPNNPRMLWVDAIAQQGLAAYCIAELAAMIGEGELEAQWREMHGAITAKVNELYWSGDDGFYFDIDCDTHEFMKVMTPASFWPLVSGMASAEQAACMADAVRDENKLGGAVPLLSLARDDGDFHAGNGMYWRGSLWLPTAYAALKGLDRSGEFALANEAARKILHHMFVTWRDYAPHTIWECYRPNEPMPANSCDEGERIVRPDFCGWSALGPISIFIEDVIGIREADAVKRELRWELPERITGAIGMRNFRFGSIVTDFVLERGCCRVHSNEPYTMVVSGRDFAVSTGDTVLDFA